MKHRQKNKTKKDSTRFRYSIERRFRSTFTRKKKHGGKPGGGISSAKKRAARYFDGRRTFLTSDRWSVPTTVHDLDLSGQMHSWSEGSHVVGWEPYYPHAPVHLSWVGSVLDRSCTTFRNVTSGSRYLDLIYLSQVCTISIRYSTLPQWE